MQQQGYKRQETLVYVVLWAILFLAPVVSIQFHHQQTEGASYPWDELFEVWKQLGMFLIAFLLHNFLLAPLIVYRQRRVLYFSAITVLVGCFFVVQCLDRPDFKGQGALEMGQGAHEMEQGARSKEQEMSLPPAPCPLPLAPEQRPLPPAPRPLPPAPGTMPRCSLVFTPLPQAHRPKGHPPVLIGQHDLVATILLIMMLGMNLGIKLYFKQRRDEQRLQQLERENLAQQLEYLRYQINPHFLMNTLNNIHALIDIDPEQAKETILELSKMMRFALYEGARQRVPLSREVAFLQSYISLMRLRYTSQVAITVNIADALPESDVPPMLFITFVENAFKHGISYRSASFIDIRLRADGDHLIFTCRNSKAPQGEKKQEGGVGLQNARRRLQLIYGSNYQLSIDDQADTYNILLEIPL